MNSNSKSKKSTSKSHRNAAFKSGGEEGRVKPPPKIQSNSKEVNPTLKSTNLSLSRASASTRTESLNLKNLLSKSLFLIMTIQRSSAGHA